MIISFYMNMTSIKRLLPLFVFIFTLAHTYSNNPGTEIKGRIIDQKTSQPLEYATVSLMSLPDSVNVDNTVTENNGSFRFKNMVYGSYYLVIQYMGYEKKQVDGIVVSDDLRQIDLGRIELQMALHDLEEFEVREDRNAVSFEIDRKVIDVSKELAAQGGSAVDALQNAPSVQVDALGNVLLRGSADFTLLINGKPTLMEPSLVLQQTPAETIESIEIITNPSVKYEAKGTAGIINLKLKKQFKDKTEGLVNLSLANGDKYSGSFSLNRQFRKVSAYAAVAYSDKTQRTTNWGYRNVFTADSVYRENIDSKRKINRFSADLKLGADYDINENNTLSFSAQLGNWKFSRDISSAYLKTADIETDTMLFQDSDEDFMLKNNFLSGDMSYSHLFNNKEGHKLDISGFYGGVINNTSDEYRIIENTYIQQINNASYRSQLRFTAEYSLPLKHDITFNAGLFTDNQFSAYKYSITDSSGITPIPPVDADFDYSNHVFAAYASVSGEVKKWFSYEAGLRMEIYRYYLDYEKDTLDHQSAATNLFPSVHLSKEISETQRIGLSYSRRVNRPDEWQLSPVIYSSDAYETKMGNPNLVQSLIDSYEFEYLLIIGKFQLNSGLYYRYSHDPIGNYMLNIDDQFVETYENLDKEINSGLEFSGGYSPVDWLQFRVTADVYYSQWMGSLADGNNLDGEGLQMNGNFSTSFTIKKNTALQFLAYYYAPGEIPQGTADAFYYFDFILKQYLFKKKLTLGLRTHNTFDSGLYHYNVSGEDYYAENWYRYEGPVFIFTLSYKLNNFKQKQPTEGVRMDFDSGLDH